MANELTTIIEGQRGTFLKVLSTPSIDFDREAGFAMQILNNNKYLYDIARENPESLRAAITNIAAIGVSLNPAEKEAYLVPRKKAVCLDISYIGLMHIAQQAGVISWGQAVVVRKNDVFKLRAIDAAPMHEYDPFRQDRGEIIGAYVTVKTISGDYLTHPMPIAAIYKIRDRSEAWKAYKRDSSKLCPWATDEEEMIKKTPVKQASKYWPRCERLAAAEQYMNTIGEEGIDVDDLYNQEPEPPKVQMPQPKAQAVTIEGNAEVERDPGKVELATAGEKAHIKGKLTAKNINESEALKACGVASLEEMTKTDFKALLSYIKGVA